MEGGASYMTYCPSGESIFGVMPKTNILHADNSRSYREDEAAGPGTLALQRASWLVNKPPLPRMFEDGVVERTLYTPDTTLDMPIPFLFEWTTLLMGRCSSLLHSAGVYNGIWGSLFQYSCDVSVIRAFLDAWSAKTNTLVTCQGELSISLMDMDRIFGLPIAGQFYDEISPMVADFKEVRSTDLPFSCRYLFLAYHHLCRSSGSNTISSAAWVEFWFRTEDDAVPVDDPWAAWRARFGKDVPSFREFTATERDVFRFLRVTPGREDDVYLAALLSVWLSRFVFWSIGDEIRPMVFKVASYMATGVRFALAGPALACLYKGLGHAATGWPSMAQWPYLYTWLAVYFHTHGEDLDVSRRPAKSTGVGSSCFCDENSDEDYDSDRSHPRKRRPNGKRPAVGASSASKKRAPLTILADASASKKKKARKEILSSPEAPAAPQEEASVVGEPAVITPTSTQSEGLPVREVAPSPLVVQEGEVVETPAPLIEAVVEAEAPPPAVEEEAQPPAVGVPAIEAVVEVIQEEVPTTEEAAEEVPIVQNLGTPPTSSSLTSSQTPSQEFLSYVEGLMVQAWRDRIAPRMLSPGAVNDTSLLADAGFAISRLQEMGHDVTSPSESTLSSYCTLKEIERSGWREGSSGLPWDEAESIARNTLAIVSSKLEEAKATLGEVIEELSEAKAEEEDARERLELAREQL
ncbi:hypothetical protein H6P81_003590 [Aristolochia fimbriata]|uniref:Aminotransferase-like plant mobile domain-containing protein n=1 Tax=Aristolochia fimbriata TaxID=158543 RepID=A0AAV7FD20_ARIFI|nr:hypothetical protein H6P81_003590 [Aristolochia fimbriata]